ncbi:MAG TPA: hypothetical protein V6D18_06930 [Thermosynechococcaceae cyanobacterium]
MLLRLILLLAIVGGLAVFALSNGSPLALTFLGMQTPVFPLALWVLGAIAAGIATHLLIVALFRLSNLLAMAEMRSQLRRGERRRGGSTKGYAPREPVSRQSPRDDADWQNWEGYEQPDDRKPPEVKTKIQESIDDWEADGNDDWDDPRRPSEPKPQPKSEPRPSYSYGSPKSKAEPTETARPAGSNSVVDADFRVIVPPFRATPEPQPNSADDWFEDDELETDAERSKRLGL